MIRAWTPSDDYRAWSLYQKVQGAGTSSVDQLLTMVDTKPSHKLFPHDFDGSVVNQVCKAYWDQVRKKFELGSEYGSWFTPIQVMSIEEFKAETLQCIKAGLWKLKPDMLPCDDERMIRARLLALKEATRLASKFKEVRWL
jgi:hypothetical protein